MSVNFKLADLEGVEVIRDDFLLLMAKQKKKPSEIMTRI